MDASGHVGRTSVYMFDRYVVMLSLPLYIHNMEIFTGKRFCEPEVCRRSWETWWYDTSKQGIGAMVIHMTNVYLAPLFQGDPCTWYIINFLLDSTIGLVIIYTGIRVCQFLAISKKWDAINFGEYGKYIRYIIL